MNPLIDWLCYINIRNIFTTVIVQFVLIPHEKKYFDFFFENVSLATQK